MTASSSRSRSSSEVPPPPIDYLDVTIVYLEMWTRPESPPRPAPRADVQVVRAEPPSVPFYRTLYNQVGSPWLWYERRLLSDERLAAVVQDPAVEVQVLYAADAPAGYAELDGRTAGEIELAYFGLLPPYIGQGLGAYFLAWAIHRAWDLGPRRLWVHTCSLDHPRALDTYRHAGFTQYACETVRIADPRPFMEADRPGDERS